MSIELKTSETSTTALRTKGGWCEVELSYILVSGPDARRYLQAQTTNDLSSLEIGFSQGSCLIDRKSRPVGCYQLFNLGPREADPNNSYAIICDTSQVPPIIEHLEKFKFADKVDFAVADTIRFLTIQGRASRSLISKIADETTQRNLFETDFANIKVAGVDVQILRHSLTGEEGFLLAVEQTQFQPVLEKVEATAETLVIKPLSSHVLNAARIEAGLAKLGIDFTGENLLAETPLDETSVSYNKGCFQGQEVLARIKGQGSPSRSVVGVQITPPPATPWEIDTPIDVNGETIGTLKSNVHSEHLRKYIGMAMIKRDFRTPGKTINATIGGQAVELRVTTLPFLTTEDPQTISRKLFEQALSVFAKEDESQTDSQDWESISLLREAILLDPLFEDAYESLGVILNRRGETDEAIEVMEHLARINPDSVMAHTNLSVFYVEKGWKEKAEEEKAISMSIRMRMAAAQVSKDKEAEEQRKQLEAETIQRMSMFQQVLEIDEDDQLANYGYGDCLVALSRFAEAVPHLQKAIALKPSHSVAYVSLGKAFEGLNQIEDARKTYIAGIEAAAKRGDGEPMKKMQERLEAIQAVPQGPAVSK